MMRIVPDEPLTLSVEEAKGVANKAYAKARAMQHLLVGNLGLGGLMARSAPVSYARLKGERAEALRQVERAQAVLDALDEAVRAIDAGARNERASP